jgi:hypothetical protein
MQPYAPRAFRFIELFTTVPGRTGITWRMKLYGIAYDAELPRASLLSAARRIAEEQLPKEKVSNYGVGFIGVHDGRDAAFVFVDFWGNENELFHRVFLSRGNGPESLAPAKPADSSVCVWDLHLQSFERGAWIKHVLRKPDAPDLDGYLAEYLCEDA